MTDDKVYPASKPPAGIPAAGNHAFPATKAQLYGANRPTYRPQPYHDRRRGRSCWCRCCIWTTLILLILILLVAGAALAVYLIYRPERPTFSVTSLKVSALNLTSSTSLTTDIAVNVTARNPNKRVVYDYSPTSVAVLTADDVPVGEGSFPGFVHGKKNTTLLRSTIGAKKRELDSESAEKLKSDLKKKALDLKIRLDSKVRVKMGALKSPRIAIRVTCEGIRVTVPAGRKKATTASTEKVKCKVDPRVKIWRWTF